MSGSITDTSGRSSAKAHRKARMSGKATRTTASAVRTRPVVASQPQVAPIQTSKVATSPAIQPVTRCSVAPTSSVVLAEGREFAKAKRKQMMRGKPNSAQSSQQKMTRVKKHKPEQIIEPRQKSELQVNTSNKVIGENRRNPTLKSGPVTDSSGRKMSKAWRQALLKGKTGEAVYKSKNGLIGSVAKITNPDASTRDIARSVREQRCTKGKTCLPISSSRSSERQERKKSHAGIEKVAFSSTRISSTLRGQGISGTQVGQGQITGAEGGACQLVSGTEYLSMEEFSTNCSSSPQASPAKVTTTQTTKGQTISGNKIGQSTAVTGDRQGQCSTVTGTNYLPADQGQMFCGTEGTTSKPSTGGFSLQTITAPQRNNGSGTVSGGNSYPDQSGSIFSSVQEGYEAPKKVLLSNTFAGNPTTGTQVGSPRAVTGDDKGKCIALTGTGYQGKEEVEQVCQTSAPSDVPRKVNVSGTLAGQIVTGDRSGTNGSNVTGGEYGRCKAVSGTSYVGTETFTSYCTTEEQASILKKFEPMARQHGHPLTGVQPGPQGLTGAQKGACELVSGTNYQGSDQVNMLCGSSQAAVPGDSDYPVTMNAIVPATNFQALPIVEATPETNVITGDGWDRGTKVTGTEGLWASQRNPSRRGSSVQAPMSAVDFRPHTMEEVPQSPITGSSGNTDTGAKVTLSGGGRA